MSLPSRALLAALVLLAPVLVVSAPAEAQAGDCDPSLDVGLVLDRSGSMSGDKIDAAKAGADALVDRLTGNDQSGLVSYSSSATLDQPLSFDHAATQSAIDALTAGGSTATGDAIDLSHDDFLNNARSGVPDVMILLTDGFTNTGLDPVTQAQQAKDDGIEIFAIGLGSSVNEPELRAIASEPDEEHFFQPQSTEELLAVFEQIAEQLVTPASGEAYATRAEVSPTTGDTAGLDKIAQTRSPPDAQATIDQRTVTQGTISVELSVVNDTSTASDSLDRTSATSIARIAQVTVRDGSTTLVSARALQAVSHSEATSTTASSSANGTQIAGLSVLGQPINATVPPNTIVPLGSQGTLILNEQIRTSQPGFSSLRVNLIHLILSTGSGQAEVIVSSAFSAASCGNVDGAPIPASAGEMALEADLADEEETFGPMTFNRGGCASNLVAVSGTGCASGVAAVSGTGGSTAGTGVAASGTGPAFTGTGAAVSGTGPATTIIGLSVSGTGQAISVIGVAVSGTGPALSGLGASISGTGDTFGLVAFSLTGSCNGMECYNVTVTEPAETWTLSVSAFGDSDAIVGAAASGTGDSDTAIGVAVSGTGNANAGTGVAASGCEGVEYNLLVQTGGVPSPHPICVDPL